MRKVTPNWRAGALEVAAGLKTLIRSGTITHMRGSLAFLQSGHESGFGRGYGSAGAGAFQYGSIGGTGPAGYFLHKDHSPGRPPEMRKFRRYHTAEQGIADLIRITDKPGVAEACALESINHYAAALYASGYYENSHRDISDENGARNIKDYATALNGFRPYLEGTDLPPPVETELTVDAAARAWRDLFGNVPIRRYVGKSLPVLPLASQAAGAGSKAATPAAPVVPVTPTIPQPHSQPIDLSPHRLVLSLRELNRGERPKQGTATTTYLGNGIYSPWETN